MEHKIIKSCEKCPFAEWFGHCYPTEKHCNLIKGEKAQFVFSFSSGWWYATPPGWCPLRKGKSFLVPWNIPEGK